METNKSVTAVEWLVEKIQQANPTFKFDALIREAKEMEKEQIGYSEIDLEVAFFEGSIHNLTFNQWLEQFKNQKNNL